MTPPYVDAEVDAEEYHADTVALSSSGARDLLPPRCPAKFRQGQLHRRPEKRHFDWGHAVHTVALGNGPEIVVVAADSWNKKKDQAIRDAAYAARKVPLLEPEYEAVQAAVASLRRDPTAAALLDLPGRPEVSAWYDDPETGARLRARFDFLPDPVPGELLLLPDLKSTVCAAPSACERHMMDHGLHQQAAWYEAAVRACDLDAGAGVQTWFVFVEKEPPHLVYCAPPDPTALEWAKVLNRKAIDVWSQCVETGDWPGYPQDGKAMSLPVWKIRQYEDEAGRGNYDTRRDLT